MHISHILKYLYIMGAQNTKIVKSTKTIKATKTAPLTNLTKYRVKVQPVGEEAKLRRNTSRKLSVGANGCANCTGRYVKGMVGNCEACEALFEDLIRDPIEMEFGSDLDIDYVRNHVMIYGCKFGDAQRVARLILNHLNLEFKTNAVARVGAYAIKFTKIGAPDLDLVIKDEATGVTNYWIGLSFRIIPWE